MPCIHTGKHETLYSAVCLLGYLAGFIAMLIHSVGADSFIIVVSWNPSAPDCYDHHDTSN